MEDFFEEIFNDLLSSISLNKLANWPRELFRNMKAQIIDYFSPDVEDVRSWIPENPNQVYYLLEVEIAPEGGVGSDVFQVMVTTPESLRERNTIRRKPVVLGRGMIVVIDNYTWGLVETSLNEIVERCEGSQWDEISKKLNRYFIWEYEDHEFID